MQEMQAWYKTEEYQLELIQRQLDLDEKNMSHDPNPGASLWHTLHVCLRFLPVSDALLTIEVGRLICCGIKRYAKVKSSKTRR